MENSKKNIIEKVTWIMKERLRVNPDLIIEDNYDKPLTGNVFHFNALNMAYLFFEVEKNLGLKIDAEKILDYEFNTINGIAEVILAQMQSQTEDKSVADSRAS